MARGVREVVRGPRHEEHRSEGEGERGLRHLSRSVGARMGMLVHFLSWQTVDCRNGIVV